MKVERLVLVSAAAGVVALLIFLLLPAAYDSIPVEVEESAPQPSNRLVTRAMPPPGSPVVALPNDAPLPAIAKTEPEALAPPEDETFMHEQPLWQPDYGELIHRGGARAEFKILDANGQEIERLPLGRRERPGEEGRTGFMYEYDYYTFSARLVRKVGCRWTDEDCRFNHETMTIICDGHAGAGLETGDYLLECVVGPYGAITHALHINRGQNLSQTLRTPGWRRVIALDFKGSDAAPLPWIPFRPVYLIPNGKIEQPTATPYVSVLLRDPPKPHPSSSMGLGGGGSSGRTFQRYKTPPRYLTDGGRYYVRVFAGLPAAITVPLDRELFECGVIEVNKSPKIELISDFTGGEWELYAITLATKDAYATYPSISNRLDKGDPGNRSICLSYEVPQSSVSLPPWDDTQLGNLAEGTTRITAPASLTRGGVTVPVKLYVSAGYTTEHRKRAIEEGKHPSSIEAVPKKCGPLASGEFVWHWDAARETCGSAFLGDGLLLRTGEREFSAGEVRHMPIDPPGDAMPVIVRLSSSPTLDAYAWQAFAHMAETKGLEFNHIAAPVLRRGRAHYAATLLDSVRRETFPSRIELQVVSYGTGWIRERDTRGWNQLARTEDGHFKIVTSAVIEGEQRDRLLRGGEIDVKLSGEEPGQGLILRAVGLDGAGLPWVEASVVDAEHDALCRHVRAREKDLNKDNKRPAYGAEQCKEARSTYAAIGEDTDDQQLQSLMGNDLYAAFADKRTRAWFANRGAWYDTRRKLRSDDHGYLVSSDITLTPGKHYIVYLWSRSRDDLMPDKRLDFIAGDRITDLGVVTLPGHE